MSTVGSRTFKSGNSEAVRLPKDVAFGREIEVTIVRSGEVLTIYPTKPSVGDLIRRLGLMERPSEIEARDIEPLPEPSGL